MSYQLKNSSRKRNEYGTGLKVIGSVLVFLFLLGLILPRSLFSFFGFFFSPLWRLEDMIAQNQLFVSHAALVNQNASLKADLDSLSQSAASLSLLEEENAELKALLGRPIIKNTILATVLKKPPFASYDTLVIDIGLDEGVEVGAKVYAYSQAAASSTADIAALSGNLPLASSAEIASTTGASVAASSAPALSLAAPASPKVLLGEVVEVGAHTSKVQLYSAPTKQYQVEIGLHHIPATATSLGGGNFQVLLPRETDVAEGDPVVIPSIEPVIFGTVGTVLSDPARPYATVLFQSPVNIFELHFVLIDKTVDKTPAPVPTATK